MTARYIFNKPSPELNRQSDFLTVFNDNNRFEVETVRIIDTAEILAVCDVQIRLLKRDGHGVGITGIRFGIVSFFIHLDRKNSDLPGIILFHTLCQIGIGNIAERLAPVFLQFHDDFIRTAN